MKRKLLSLLLSALVSVGALGFAACENGSGGEYATYQITKSNTTNDVLRVEILVIESKGQNTLLQVMERAQSNGDLIFEAADGMVTSINGTAQTTNSYWMLYTSDAEMANSEWGTITIGEKTLGSAIVGASVLSVVEGELYVWEYQTF